MASGTRTLKVVITGDGKGAMRAFESLDRASQGMGDGVERSGRRGARGMSAMLVPMGGISKGLAALGAAAGIGILTKKAYDLGASFEQNLNVLAALDKTLTFDKTRKAIQATIPEITKLGFSTVDASSAMVELVKAGRTGDDALKALVPTMQLARAGALNIEDASTAVSNSLNVFGEKAGDAANVANVLAGAANESSASVGDLLSALQMSASVAAQAGLNIEETAASLAILANNGLRGSDAGTSLKTMLLRLRSPVEGSDKALQALGVTVYDGEGRMRNFNDILLDLSSKLKGLSDAEKATALKDIFGQDAIRSASILTTEVGKNADAFKNMVAAVDQAGSVQSVAEARTQGLSGAINRLKALAQSAGAALYTAFSPTLGRFLNGLIDKGAALGKAFQALGSGNTLAFGAIMDRLVGGGRRYIDFFKNIGDGILKARDAIAGFINNLRSSGGGDGFLGQLSGKFRELVAIAVPAIKSLVATIQQDFLPRIRQMWQEAQPWLQQLGQIFIQVFDSILVIVRTFVSVVKFLWGILGDTILNTLMSALRGVMQAIKGAFQIIQGILNIFAGLFTGDWGRMWEGVKQILAGAWNLIVGVLKAIIFGRILALFRSLLTGTVNIFRSLATGAVNLFRGGVNALGGLANNLLSLMTAPIRILWNTVRNLFSGGLSAVRVQFNSFVSGLVVSAVNLAARIVGAFTGIPGQMLGIGRNIVSSLASGIRNAAGAVLSAAQSVVDKIPGPIKKALGINSPSKVMMGLGKNVTEGLALGIGGNSALVTRSMDKLSGAVAGTEFGTGGSRLAPSGGGAPISVTVNVHGTVKSERDLVEAVRQGIYEAQRRAGDRPTVR